MTEPSTSSSLKGTALVRDVAQGWRRDGGVLRPYMKRLQREYEFCWKFDHYSAGQRQELQRVDRIQPATADVYDVVRYQSAMITAAEPYLDVKPVDEIKDPEAAELVRATMEREINDPERQYRAIRRAMVRMGFSARVGAVLLDVDPVGCGYGPEVVPRLADPRTLSWTAPYLHPNQYGCPRFREVLRMPLEQVKRMRGWKHVDQLRADDGETELAERISSVDPAAPLKPGEGTQDVPMVTICKEWRRDEFAPRTRTLKTAALPPGERHFACAECDWRSPVQDQQALAMESMLEEAAAAAGADMPAAPPFEWPEAMPCPQCGTPLQRIDVTDESLTEMEYPHGRRFVIVAPLQPAVPPLVDEPWPEHLTGFPVGYYVPDPLPLEPSGNSTTFVQWDPQCMIDSMFRLGHEQMHRNRDLLVVLEGTLHDSAGEPYQHDGSGDYVAYATSADGMAALKQFQGSGLNSAWPTFLSSVQDSMQRNRGIGQIAMSAQELKGTPVGTVARQQESGDVPVDDAIAVLRELETMLFTRWFQLGKSVWTRARAVRLMGDDGNAAYRLMNLSSAPNVDIRVTAQPSLDPSQLAKMDALTKIRGATPAELKWLAKVANLPMELMTDLIAEQASTLGDPNDPSSPGAPDNPADDAEQMSPSSAAA